MGIIGDIFWNIPLGGTWGVFFEWLPMLVSGILVFGSIGALIGASRGAMLAGERPPGCPFGYIALAGTLVYGFGFLKALF